MISINPSTNSQLSAWANYYMLVGSSGAALIGLQFVVIALVSDISTPATTDSINAFGTPTVVHLTGALLISAIMSIPWPTLWPVSVALTLCGVGGIAYGAITIRRARRQTTYEPILEDWLWYAIFPSGVYALLSMGAVFLCTTAQFPMFVIGVATLGLLFIAIHNAWDSVTHLVVTGTQNESKKKKRKD